MKILKLELENFRAIKHLAVEFPNGANADILGANGTGKTTVANAVVWLLTGEPATGEKEFTPKTIGAHNLHHKATMLVEDENGHQVTLGKDFYEVWTKKRGAKEPEFSGHTTDYTINGVPAKKKEYETATEAACGGDLAKIKVLTILGFFSEALKAEDRRKILFDVCGDVDDDKVLALPELDGLKELLKIPGTGGGYYSPDQLKKIKVMERHDINKTLEHIPERIDEINLQVTEEAPGEREKLAKEIEDLQTKRAELNNRSNNETVRSKLADKKAELATARAQYIEYEQKEHREDYEKINQLSEQKLEQRQELDTLKIQKAETERILQTTTAKRQALLQEFQQVKTMEWTGATTCPTCGQPLPPERIQSSKEAFMQQKAERKMEIQKEGQECSKEVIQAMQNKRAGILDSIEQMAHREFDIDAQILNIKKRINSSRPFEETDEARRINNEIKECEQVLAGEMEADDLRRKQLAEIDTAIKDMNKKMGLLLLNDTLAERIAELEAQQQEASGRLEGTDRAIHLCEEFTRAKVRLVTDNINDKFQTISFKLFKEQINGGLKECCEALIPNQNGTLVDYKAANTAAKINAGLEIIEVLAKHYGMNLPVLIDGAESICEPRKMAQQTIRLIVSAPDKSITTKVSL